MTQHNSYSDAVAQHSINSGAVSQHNRHSGCAVSHTAPRVSHAMGVKTNGTASGNHCNLYIVKNLQVMGSLVKIKHKKILTSLIEKIFSRSTVE